MKTIFKIQIKVFKNIVHCLQGKLQSVTIIVNHQTHFVYNKHTQTIAVSPRSKHDTLPFMLTQFTKQSVATTS